MVVRGCVSFQRLVCIWQAACTVLAWFMELAGTARIASGCVLRIRTYLAGNLDLMKAGANGDTFLQILLLAVCA